MPAPRRHPQQSLSLTKKLSHFQYVVEVRATGFSQLEKADTEAEAVDAAEKLVGHVERIAPGQCSVFIHRYVRAEKPIWVKWPSDTKGKKAST